MNFKLLLKIQNNFRFKLAFLNNTKIKYKKKIINNMFRKLLKHRLCFSSTQLVFDDHLTLKKNDKINHYLFFNSKMYA